MVNNLNRDSKAVLEDSKCRADAQNMEGRIY